MSEQEKLAPEQVTKVANLKERGLWCDKHNCERTIDSDCHRCHGDGQIEDMDDVICGGVETCYACGGSGQGWPDCEWCLDEDNGYD